MIARMALMGAVLAGLGGLSLQHAPLPWIAAVSAGLCVAAEVVRARIGPGSGSLWAGITAGVLLAIGAQFAVEREPAVALGALLAYLQVHRRVTAGGRGDDRVSLLLAGLMLVASASVDVGPFFLVLAAVWAASLPLALRGRRARWGRDGLLALGVVGMSMAGFVVAPRPVQTRLGGQGAVGLVGFAPEVELGSLNALLDDEEVVFRARLTGGAPSPIYWRGMALDAFDGQRWRASLPPEGRTELQLPRTLPERSVTVSVIRESGADGVVFVPGAVVGLQTETPGLTRDPQGGWHVATVAGRVKYRAVVMPPFGPGAAALPPESPDDVVVNNARRLPGPLLAAVEPLAARVAGGGSEAAQIEQIARYLRDEFAYTRRPADAGVEEPLQRFLFESRAGHCEYFSSALAVLARARGIPARVVNGFVSEAPAEDGWVTVRRHHAHSWTEVHLPNEGWVVFDATPGPGAPDAEGASFTAWTERVDRWWLDRVVAYDGEDQRRALVRTVAFDGQRFAWILAGTLLVTGMFGLAYRLAVRWRHGPAAPRPPKTTSALGRLYARARQHLAAHGIHPPQALPPVAAAEWVMRHHPSSEGAALHQLAWLYYEGALGGASRAEQVKEGRALLQEVLRWRPSTLGDEA